MVHPGNKEALVLRELEKAAAAFAPVDEAALVQWPVIATGNWGCGAFETGQTLGGWKDERKGSNQARLGNKELCFHSRLFWGGSR